MKEQKVVAHHGRPRFNETPKLVGQTPDFRMYEPIDCIDNLKQTVTTIQLCEDLIDGRWEPFYAIVKVRNL